tara:strand:- start:133 stop:699 length:567 start_codon:yes stop_codon:yes gene_type:complete
MNVKTIKTVFAAILFIATLSGCQSNGNQPEPVTEVTNQPSKAEQVTVKYVSFFNKKDTKKSNDVLKTCNVQKITVADLKAKAVVADGAEEPCFESFLAYAKLFKTSPEPVAFSDLEADVRKFIAPKSMMEKAAETTSNGLDKATEYSKKGADYIVEGGKTLFNNVSNFFSSDEEENSAKKEPAPVKTL